MLDIGLGGGLSGIFVEGTMVSLGGSAVGVSFGTLGESVVQSGWTKTVGASRGALRAGAVGGFVVTLEKMREIFWMAAN